MTAKAAPAALARSMAAKVIYTKHHLKFRKNQADNLEYMDFGADFFLYFIGV